MQHTWCFPVPGKPRRAAQLQLTLHPSRPAVSRAYLIDDRAFDDRAHGGGAVPLADNLAYVLALTCCTHAHRSLHLRSEPVTLRHLLNEIMPGFRAAAADMPSTLPCETDVSLALDEACVRTTSDRANVMDVASLSDGDVMYAEVARSRADPDGRAQLIMYVRARADACDGSVHEGMYDGRDGRFVTLEHWQKRYSDQFVWVARSGPEMRAVFAEACRAWAVDPALRFCTARKMMENMVGRAFIVRVAADEEDEDDSDAQNGEESEMQE